jgi:hypothetical protein
MTAPIKNVSGRNDTSDGEGEEVQKKFSYVEYWSCFAENNPGIFKSMNCPMPDGAYGQSSTLDTYIVVFNAIVLFGRQEEKDKLRLRQIYPPEPRDPGSKYAFSREDLGPA